MKEQFSRSGMLLGEEAMKKLEDSRVAVFGIGGVGGYVVEALARSGVGTIDIIDNDTVVMSNLNRQIIATMDTVGRDKVDVMTERILSINPEAVVHARKCFYLPETAGEFDFTVYDYVVDAIDTVTGKIHLILQAKEAGVPVISAMGAGNKMDPTQFEVADIYSTSVDPLSRVMRRELKKRGVESLKVVYSKEKPISPETETAEGYSKEKPISPETETAEGYSKEKPISPETEIAEGYSKEKPISPETETAEGYSKEKPISPETETAEGNKIPDFPPAESEDFSAAQTRRSTPGSLAFVPSVMGLIIAGEVIKDLTGKR